MAEVKKILWPTTAVGFYIEKLHFLKDISIRIPGNHRHKNGFSFNGFQVSLRKKPNALSTPVFRKHDGVSS